MIRRASLLALLGLLWLTVTVSATDPGIIEGKVVNGSTPPAPVAGTEVVLLTYRGDVEIARASAVVDHEGRFAFVGLSAAGDLTYQVKLTFQGADYQSEVIAFSKDEGRKTLTMKVFDSTTDDRSLKVGTVHLVIKAEPDSLLVGEFYQVISSGDKTYIGQKAITADGKKETLRFSLPPGAFDLRLARGLMECCVVNTEDSLSDTMAVEPGTKQVAFSYRVKYEKGQYALHKRIHLPIDALIVLIQDNEGRIQAISEQLTLGEPVQVEGLRFIQLWGEGLEKGATVTATLTGLSTIAQAGQLSTTGWAVAVGLLVFLLGLAYTLSRRRVGVTPAAAAPSAVSSAEALLQELADLDDDYEAGRLPQEAYQRQRAQKKARLMTLLQRTQQ